MLFMFTEFCESMHRVVIWNEPSWSE